MRTIEAPTDNLAGTTIHKFEAAGLGKAPYTFLGVQVKVGPITMPDGGQVGSPGQPMGTCNFCGTGIRDCFYLRSADGREFYVGCDCIKKVGDAGLLRYVKAEEAAKRRAKAEAKRQAEWQRRAEIRRQLRDLIEAKRETLASMPHPMRFEGMSLLNYAEFCERSAGEVKMQSLIDTIKAV